MNVMLTDVTNPAARPKAKSAPPTKSSPAEVSSPTAKTVSKVDKTNDGEKNDFRSMMQENLKPESKSKVQLVENKEVKSESIGAVGTPGLSAENTAWLENLTVSDTDLIPDNPVMATAGDAIADSELLPNLVTAMTADKIVSDELAITENTAIMSSSVTVVDETRVMNTTLPANADARLMKSKLPAVGDILPANGNSLPLPADQIRPIGPLSSMRMQALQQASQVGNNMMEGVNVKAANSDMAQFTGNSHFMDADTLDSMTAKPFDLNGLGQTMSDSSSTKLQAAMAAINGMQNSSANPGTANPVASTAVLANGLDRLVMTNPDSAAEWGSGLGERVSLMLNQKQNAATIRIDPPMLGKMDIQIQIKDDVTNVTINTQHAQTRDMVDNASNRLREFLQDAGYQNVNVDVSHQSDQQKNDAQFMTAVDSGDGMESASSVDDPVIAAQVSVSSALVDYFA